MGPMASLDVQTGTRSTVRRTNHGAWEMHVGLSMAQEALPKALEHGARNPGLRNMQKVVRCSRHS